MDKFPTSDTALAAYLITADYKLYSIDYSQPRFQFIFEDANGIKEAADLYLLSKALVEPTTFNRIYRRLTRTLHKQLQWGEE